MKASQYSTVCFFTALIAVTAAQVTCSGTLNAPNPVTANVNVPNGASCTLSTSVTGSVTVGSGSSLSTSGTITLSGGVSATGSSSVTIGGNTNAGSISVTNVDTFSHSGTATGVSIFGNGASFITGGKVTSGVSRNSGTGSLTVCGGDIFGGISFVSVTGSLSLAAGAGCAPTTLNGAILVEKGTGSVTVIGATTTASDVNVVEQEGDVMLQNTQLSDLGVTLLTGKLTVTNVDADSDVKVTSISGDITLSAFTTLGDLQLVSPGGKVTVSNTNFGLEVVSVENAGGAVSFTNVEDINLSIKGSPSATVSGSTLNKATFENNGALTLNNNVINDSLTCVGNGAVSGSGNTLNPLFTSGAGQCAAIV